MRCDADVSHGWDLQGVFYVGRKRHANVDYILFVSGIMLKTIGNRD